MPPKRASYRTWILCAAIVGAIFTLGRFLEGHHIASEARWLELSSQVTGFAAFGAIAAALYNWTGKRR